MRHTCNLVHMLVDSEVISASFVTGKYSKNLFTRSASVPWIYNSYWGWRTIVQRFLHTLFCNTEAAYIPMDGALKSLFL